MEGLPLTRQTGSGQRWTHESLPVERQGASTWRAAASVCSQTATEVTRGTTDDSSLG